MLKKLCFSTALAVLYCASITPSTDRITAIKNSLAHIAQAKSDIYSEKEEAIALNKKALEFFYKKADIDHIMDHYAYELELEKTNATLALITANSDFTKTINYLTDFQVTCIVDKQITYNDIIYTPEAYPLEQKRLIQTIDSVAKSDDLLFNVFYIQATQRLGYQFLLEKLTIEEQYLITERTALEAANQSTAK